MRCGRGKNLNSFLLSPPYTCQGCRLWSQVQELKLDSHAKTFSIYNVKEIRRHNCSRVKGGSHGWRRCAQGSRQIFPRRCIWTGFTRYKVRTPCVKRQCWFWFHMYYNLIRQEISAYECVWQVSPTILISTHIRGENTIQKLLMKKVLILPVGISNISYSHMSFL